MRTLLVIALIGTGCEWDRERIGDTTSYHARTGSAAIGGYFEIGHRWLEQNPNDTFVSFGLSFRLPMMAGVEYLSGM